MSFSQRNGRPLGSRAAKSWSRLAEGFAPSAPLNLCSTVYVCACAAGVPITAVTNTAPIASADIQRWCCPDLVIIPLLDVPNNTMSIEFPDPFKCRPTTTCQPSFVQISW